MNSGKVASTHGKQKQNMRTKTLLLTAVLGVAAAATSMADTFSVNAVGYVNLTMPPGFSLVANQLNKSNNTLNAVLPSVPSDSLVYTFANNIYTVDIFDGSVWLDANSGNPSTTVIQPGKGFFFNNPNATPVTVTLVGEVPQGTNTVALVPGYTLISSVVPQQLSLVASNGFPQVSDMLYLSFSNNAYSTLVNDGSQWLDANSGNPTDAKPAVGQGFFINNPNATSVNWTRSFSVNN